MVPRAVMEREAREENGRMRSRRVEKVISNALFTKT